MNQTYLYGYIDSVGNNRFYRHNKRVILSLPKNPYLTGANDWPLFHSSMFSMGPYSSQKTDLPNYLGFVIHFAGVYKQMDKLYIEWQQKFETLLSMLYWTTAIVHLDTLMEKKLCYQWWPDTALYDPTRKQPPVEKWERYCFECNCDSIPWENS